MAAGSVQGEEGDIVSVVEASQGSKSLSVGGGAVVMSVEGGVGGGGGCSGVNRRSFCGRG